MKRSDIGKRSQAATGGGFFGTLLGNGGGGQQASQQAIPSDQDKITPRGGGKVPPSMKEVSLGISPHGDVITLPLWERHCLLCGQ
jgi:hypothetical protein